MRLRIRTAVFFVYVGASAVGFAVLMRYMLAEVRPRYVSAVRANLDDTAHALATALTGRTLADAAAALKKPGSFQARLEAADGRVLFDSAEPPAPVANDYEGNARWTAKRVGDRLIDGSSDSSDLAVATTAPLQLSDAGPVRLGLSRSFRSVNTVIWTERKKLGLIGFVIAGIMVVAGWWIASKLTKPLERLTAYALGVRDGLPATAPDSRAVEVAALTRAFEEMRDALEGRQHVERYTQALAHEVKAPLAAIRGAAELLDENMPPAQRAKFLGNIRHESARIQQIVERLLELSSLEARKTLRQTETVAVPELVEEAAAAMRPAFEVAGVKLAAASEPAAVLGERVLLREALLNLLQNALDFAPPGSEVSLRATASAERLTWTVDDRGPGVPDYALSRVFERFYSLPRPGTDRKSTGLGLALVREIAHLHGGDATLGNRPGGGARAEFWVPRRS